MQIDQGLLNEIFIKNGLTNSDKLDFHEFDTVREEYEREIIKKTKNIQAH